MTGRLAQVLIAGVTLTVLAASSAGAQTTAEVRAAPMVGNPATGPDFDGDGVYDLAVGIPGEDEERGAVQILFGSTTGLGGERDQLWNGDTVGVGDGAEVGDRFGSTLAWGDFDVDGMDDLAIGLPDESIIEVGARAGVVLVLRGSPTGLVAAGAQLWSQDTPELPGEAGRGDQFGASMIARDFDADGMDDLAIGVPGEDEPRDAGAVQVLFGTPGGLDVARNQMLRQPGSMPKRGERFGYAIGAGHLDEPDPCFDLVVSAQDKVGGARRAGAVTVLFGTVDGVSTTQIERWTQDSPGVVDKAERDDLFGRSIAVHDLTADDFSDLVIGVHESLPGAKGAGAVAVLYGTMTGLSADRNQLWTQDSSGVPDDAEAGDDVGVDLATANFDGDGYGDVAIGAPGESVVRGEVTNAAAGVVLVLHGSADGLIADRAEVWAHDLLGDPLDGSEAFGAAITRGNFNGDTRIDLAVGAPGADGSRGSVTILHGALGGFTPETSEAWDQDSAGVEDVAEPGDRFAADLMAH